MDRSSPLISLSNDSPSFSSSSESYDWLSFEASSLYRGEKILIKVTVRYNGFWNAESAKGMPQWSHYASTSTVRNGLNIPSIKDISPSAPDPPLCNRTCTGLDQRGCL